MITYDDDGDCLVADGPADIEAAGYRIVAREFWKANVDRYHVVDDSSGSWFMIYVRVTNEQQVER